MKSKIKEKLGYIFFWIAFFICCFVVCFCGGLLVTSFIGGFDDHTATITIVEKERVNEEYMIWGYNEEGESVVYCNSDAPLRGKFNSADFYGGLEEGKTYNVTLIGYRVPFLSWYENILTYEEVVNENE